MDWSGLAFGLIVILVAIAVLVRVAADVEVIPACPNCRGRYLRWEMDRKKWLCRECGERFSSVEDRCNRQRRHKQQSRLRR